MSQINLNRNISFRTAPAQQNFQEEKLANVQLPYMYESALSNKPEESLKEKIKKFDMMGLVWPWFENPLAMLGIFAALSMGVEKFTKACDGEYSKSILGKTANLGDKIEKSSVVQSKPFQSFLKFCQKGIDKVSQVFKNSDLVNAVKSTPTRPELGLVKDELLTMKQRLVHEFKNIARTLKLTQDGFVPLESLGASKKELDYVKKLFSGIDLPEEKLSNALQLKNLGLADDVIKDIVEKSDSTAIVKSKTLEKLGLSADKLKEIVERKHIDQEDVKLVKDACLKGRGIKIGDGEYKLLGKFQPFKRNITIEEISNKMRSMTLNDGAKTKTGKAFATLIQKFHRGLTFGNGKLGILFWVTPMLYETVKDVVNAEPREKLSTAAYGAIESVSWVFTFPLALTIMHHLTGMKYAGMGPEKVEQYRTLIKDFNEKVTNGTFKNKAEYDKALKILKKGADGKSGLEALKKVEGQTLITKMFRKIASFITMDLEAIKTYNDKNLLTTIANKIPHFFKALGGVPMRLMIWVAISMGVLGTAISKGVKFLFGNYYDRFKDEEHEALKKEQKKHFKEDLYKRLQEIQLNNMQKGESFENLGLVADSNINTYAANSNLNNIPMKSVNSFKQNSNDAKSDKRVEQEFKSIPVPEPRKFELLSHDNEEIFVGEENPTPTIVPQPNEIIMNKASADFEQKPLVSNENLDSTLALNEKEFAQNIKINNANIVKDAEGQTLAKEIKSDSFVENVNNRQNIEKNLKEEELNQNLDNQAKAKIGKNNVKANKKSKVIDSNKNDLKNKQKVQEQAVAERQFVKEDNVSAIENPLPVYPLSNMNQQMQNADSYTYVPQTKAVVPPMKEKSVDNYTYIPSSNNVLNKKEEKSNNIATKYIPSQLGANIPKTFDNSGLDAALRRADLAEHKALQVLAGDFSAF